MKKLILPGLLVLGIAQSASATPMYYTFTAQVTDTIGSSYYLGPVRQGDIVYYSFLVDMDVEAPGRTDVGDQNYFFAQLAWIDYGHGLGIQSFNDGLSYGYSEPDSPFCHTNGCGQLLAFSPDRPFVGVYSRNTFTDYVGGAYPIFINDRLLSDAEIFNARVTSLLVAPASVPEPSALALFAVGVAGVQFTRRVRMNARRRR